MKGDEVGQLRKHTDLQAILATPNVLRCRLITEVRTETPLLRVYVQMKAGAADAAAMFDLVHEHLGSIARQFREQKLRTSVRYVESEAHIETLPSEGPFVTLAKKDAPESAILAARAAVG